MPPYDSTSSWNARSEKPSPRWVRAASRRSRSARRPTASESALAGVSQNRRTSASAWRFVTGTRVDQFVHRVLRAHAPGVQADVEVHLHGVPQHPRQVQQPGLQARVVALVGHEFLRVQRPAVHREGGGEAPAHFGRELARPGGMHVPAGPHLVRHHHGNAVPRAVPEVSRQHQAARLLGQREQRTLLDERRPPGSSRRRTRRRWPRHPARRPAAARRSRAMSATSRCGAPATRAPTRVHPAGAGHDATAPAHWPAGHARSGAGARTPPRPPRTPAGRCSASRARSVPGRTT